MSTTASSSKYVISMNGGGTDATASVRITANETNAFGDAQAAQLAQALLAAFPPAWNMGASANAAKNAQSTTTTTANVAAAAAAGAEAAVFE
jgi:hypothetical protein